MFTHNHLILAGVTVFVLVALTLVSTTLHPAVALWVGIGAGVFGTLTLIYGVLRLFHTRT